MAGKKTRAAEIRRRRGLRSLQSPEALERRNLMAAVVFQDVTAAAGITLAAEDAQSISWTDFNSDGLQDLWIGRHGSGEQRLYINQGDGTFTDIAPTTIASSSGLDRHGSIWVDFDNDGDPDMLQTIGGNRGVAPGTVIFKNKLYVNQGGKLVDMEATSGLSLLIGRGRETDWADVNKDGKLDAFLANEVRFDQQSSSRLFVQTGKGFEAAVDATADLNVNNVGVASAQFHDINNDKIPDLLFLGENKQLEVRLGGIDANGQPFYTDGAAMIPSFSLTGRISDFAVADFNNDGYNDIFLATAKEKDVVLLYQPLKQKFADVSLAAGMTTETNAEQVVAGDFDNDGRVDVYLACGTGSQDLADVVYYNQGGGKFVRAVGDTHTGPETPNLYIGKRLAAADYDNDGDIDLFQSGSEYVATPHQLLQNQGNSNHWLEIKLQGTQSTAQGIGAKVTLIAGGQKQFREATTGKHQFSQDSTTLHFGLGSQTKISQLRVEWPSGLVTTLSNVTADQILTIREADTTTAANAQAISVKLNGASLSGQVTPTASTQYYRFSIGNTSTLSTEIVGQNINVQVLDSSETMLSSANTDATGRITLASALAPGDYYLRVQLTGTAAESFVLKPIWKRGADTQGPLVEDVTVDDSASATDVAVLAVVNDGINGGSNIQAAEYYLDSTSGVAVPMMPNVGGFDNTNEYVKAMIPADVYNALTTGDHTVYVRGQDKAGNWGDFKSFTFTKQTSAPPVVDLKQTSQNILLNASSFPLFRQATLTDADSPSLAGGSISIQFAPGQTSNGDIFQVLVDGGLRISDQPYSAQYFEVGGKLVGEFWGGYNGHPFKIRFLNDATPADIQKVLQRIGYRYTLPSSPSDPRTLDIVINDGHGGRVHTTMDVTVSQDSLPPVVTIANTGNYKEGSNPVILAAKAGVTDPDSRNFDKGSLTVTVTAGGTANDILGIQLLGTAAGQFSQQGSYLLYGTVVIGTVSGGTGTTPLVVKFNEKTTVPTAQALLRNLTFKVNGEIITQSSRTLSFVLNDGRNGVSTAAIKTITVIPTPEPPTITMSPSIGYKLNATPIKLAASGTISDVDTPIFNGGVLEAKVTAGSDASNRLTINGVFIAVGGSVTIDGVVIGSVTANGFGVNKLSISLNDQATKARVQSLLRQISFATVKSTLQTQRQVTFTLSDGAGGVSTPVVKTIYRIQ